VLIDQLGKRLLHGGTELINEIQRPLVRGVGSHRTPGQLPVVLLSVAVVGRWAPRAPAGLERRQARV